MLYILFIAQLMVGMGFSSIFPFLPLYVNDLGAVSSLSIELLSGLVYSGQAFTMMLTSPLWGAIADRFGRKLMVERSMFGGAIIVLLMAFARSAEDLVVIRMIQGMITGTVAAVNALVASTAPREESGYAMGMIQVGMGTGVAFGPMMGGAVADAFGYRAAFYITALLLFLSGLTVTLWVKEPGRNPDPAGLPAKAAGKSKKPGILRTWQGILRCKGIPATFTLSFLNNLCRNMLTPVVPLFIPLLMPGSTLINTFTGLVAGIASATTTLSSVYLGRLGDRVGQQRILVISLICSGILYGSQSLVTSGWHLLILQALTGIALGGLIPAISALLAKLSEPGTEGAVYGLENSIGSGARSLAPIIGSAIMYGWGPRLTFVVTGVVLLATAVFARSALPKMPVPRRA